MRTDTTVTAIDPDRTVTLLSPDGLRRCRGEAVLLASGARERAIGSLPVTGTRARVSPAWARVARLQPEKP